MVLLSPRTGVSKSLTVFKCRSGWESTLRLAERHQLRLYAAAYLELALRRHLPIATRNGQLADAARAASLAVIPTT
jgi:predicted nucleic acid-binding protein